MEDGEDRGTDFLSLLSSIFLLSCVVTEFHSLKKSPLIMEIAWRVVFDPRTRPIIQTYVRIALGCTCVREWWG